ncbi:MAG: arylsulfatase A-like enzyme [Planctomycetota bacterium]|jgi:arylsulfatase A-like enzyme
MPKIGIRDYMRAPHRRGFVGWISALALLSLAACGASDDARRGHGGRGVLVLAIDSLRADHMSYSGYDRVTTPNLDSLIKDGVVFTETWSAAPELIASHGGLLTGCDPLILRQPVFEDGSVVGLSRRWLIPRPAPAVSSEFLAAGYATAAFVDHAWLAPQYGFGRGFERYDTFRGGIVVDETDFGASQLGRRVLDWIRTLESDRDWFAYVDINDLERSMRHSDLRWSTYFTPRPELDEIPPVSEAVHSFFAIPKKLWPGAHQTVGEYEASYDGFVHQLDRKIGRLIGTLDRAGRLEETTICVVGTYGVGFGEAGLYLDHGTLSDVDLSVPWIIKYPKSSTLERGVFSPSLASTIDIAPTLLELAGLRIPPGVHGHSQLPALISSDAPPVNEYVFSRGGISKGYAVHDSRYSYQDTVHAFRGDGTLNSSWYGTPNPKNPAPRRYLRDRHSGSGPGDQEPSSLDQESADRMRAVGEEWYTWIERARLALHAPEWIEEPVSPKIKRQLEERGLTPVMAD